MGLSRRDYYTAAGCALVLFALFFAASTRVFSASYLTGWAWSDNIGWVSLNCSTGGPSGESICAMSNYFLALNADNTITGYAWSENIGWIQFGGLSGFPAGAGTQAVNAQLSGSSVVGWARALSNGGGWDGWISLGSSPGHGDGLTYANGSLSGYAWGDEVVGWLQFNGASTPCGTPVVCTDPTHYNAYTDVTCLDHPAAACTPGLLCVNDFGCTSVPPSGCVSVNESNPNCTPPVDKNYIVRKGNSTTIYWNVTNVQTGCTLKDQSGATLASGAEFTYSGSYNTGAITSKQVYTFSCDNGAFADTAMVNVIPEYKEL